MGLCLPLVYNTSAYDSPESLKVMDGLVDVYMPDFKLWDVAPDGSKTLVTRGDSRVATEAGDPATGTLATELWGNHWAFPAGDTIELQVGQTDAPTFRPDSLPSSLSISSLSVTLPTREPGTMTLTPAA